ncbi:hypothetical protein HPB48_025682 [Haemaphysalis longicornis]|uniref:Peptidase M13 N-terminal domain-containing protein n=1 Tax=Haemaphysalis longicornis TaxID=44386 RepID=A0A9J6HA42_HAELO|nr:hypothetical protein HPB48_025682 [Haemaphysalis longicornis]
MIIAQVRGPLKAVLAVLGGWPVVEGASWDASRFHWLDALIQYRNFGYSHDILLDLSVIPDFHNNTRYIIYLDQTPLRLPDRTYMMRGLNDTAVEVYLRLMFEAAHLLGTPDKEAARTELMDALQFEITLANYSTPREERRNISKLYNKMPFSELKKLAPKIDGDRYFNSLLTDKMASDEPVNVVVLDFVQRFQLLLETMNEINCSASYGSDGEKSTCCFFALLIMLYQLFPPGSELVTLSSCRTTMCPLLCGKLGPSSRHCREETEQAGISDCGSQAARRSGAPSRGFTCWKPMHIARGREYVESPWREPAHLSGSRGRRRGGGMRGDVRRCEGAEENKAVFIEIPCTKTPMSFSLHVIALTKFRQQHSRAWELQ